MQKFHQQYAHLPTATIDDEEIIQLLNPIANFDATTCYNIISNNTTIPKTYYLNTPYYKQKKDNFILS